LARRQPHATSRRSSSAALATDSADL
jgi:hypothetical protein